MEVTSSSLQPPRKERRAVSDDRTIYEEGISEEMLQQRLQEISRKREELQHVEIEMLAQTMARAGFLDLQNSFLLQIKEQAEEANQLKEKIHDRDQHIHELDIRLVEMDKELRSIKIDHEEAWAKDDLLREQKKELTSFRREHDKLEAERAKYLKQIDNLQEHVQEKERELLALDEQHRVAQKTIIYKDEQLREAQTWITHAQEMDALHTTTNQSLQAEIRQHAEQFAQYYFGLQQQFAEVERHRLQEIQRLQIELAEAKECNGTNKDSPNANKKIVDSSSYAQNKDNSTELPASVAAVSSPILGVGTFLPPGQITAIQPFLMYPQGVSHSISSPNASIHADHFQSTPTFPREKHLQNQQAAADVSQSPYQNNYQQAQMEQALVGPDGHYSYKLPDETKVLHPDNLNVRSCQQPVSYLPTSGSSEKLQLPDEYGKQPQQTSHVTVPFHAVLYASPEQSNEIKGQDQNAFSTISDSNNQFVSGEKWSASPVITTAVPTNSVTSSDAAECNNEIRVSTELATRTTGSIVHAKTTEPTLLDERSLLTCIVRAIPAGAKGRIRISTTLPNRLGKMLAPLHWHDYKKQYGKLDEFVAHHPELFVVEGDFIQLREGAQEIISATTAFAKVAAAAAAAAAPASSLFSSVALTPVAQSNRLKGLFGKMKLSS